MPYQSFVPRGKLIRSLLVMALFGTAGLILLAQGSAPTLEHEYGIRLLFSRWPVSTWCLMLGTWLVGLSAGLISLGYAQGLLAALSLSGGLFIFGLGVVENVALLQMDALLLPPQLRSMLAQPWDPEIGRMPAPFSVLNVELPHHGGNCVPYQRSPDGCWRTQGLTTDIFTDDWGFNHRHRPEHPAIIFLGDSFTQGFDVSPDECWVTRFAHASKLPVWNLGVGGYSIAAECLLFERLGLHSSATHVVLVVLTENDPWDHAAWLRWQESKMPYPEWLRHEFCTAQPGHWLALHKLLAARKRAPPPLDPIKVTVGTAHCEVGFMTVNINSWCHYALDDELQAREEFADTERWLQRFASIARTHGKHPVVLLLCGKLDVYPPAEPLSPAWQHLLTAGGLLTRKGDEIAALDATRKILAVGDRLEHWYRSRCQPLGIPCHAVRYALREAAAASRELLFYAFDTHMNVAGNRVVAAEFLAWWQAGFPDWPPGYVGQRYSN